MRILPSQDELHKLIDYDPHTGALTWRSRGIPGWDKRWAGKPAFNSNNHGYKVGVLHGRRSIGAHRVAYKHFHGVDAPEVDHINGVRTDNRIINLRSVTTTENRRNAAIPRTNKSGVVGVTWRADKKRWVAHISLSNRYVFLGYFRSKEEAAVRRKAAEIENGFHPNHGRQACR